jgi:hypothetical protein
VSARVNRLGFIALLPNGTVDSREARFWNGIVCCDFFDNGVDDRTYLKALVQVGMVMMMVMMVMMVMMMMMMMVMIMMMIMMTMVVMMVMVMMMVMIMMMIMMMVMVMVMMMLRMGRRRRRMMAMMMKVTMMMVVMMMMMMMMTGGEGYLQGGRKPGNGRGSLQRWDHGADARLPGLSGVLR